MNARRSVRKTACITAAWLALAVAAAESAALVSYRVVDDTIPTPLTFRAGDPENGRAVYVDRERGHCLLCHQAAGVDEPFPGTIGPDLSDVGLRFTAAEMRYRIVDPTRSNPETVMPAYYRVDGLNQVGQQYVAKPVLTAQEVEDLIAFLQTLTSEEP